MLEEVTKDLFLKYEEVRKSGRYNMVTEGLEVMEAMGMDMWSDASFRLYAAIIKNYAEYAKRWL